MLQSLTMKNVALIESATISFTSGLNVLSGETGSGKSVVVDSLNFVLGGKADKAMIRSGAAECSVQAVFSSEERIADLISSLGYEPDDDLLIISRRFSTEGKGEIRINGQPASATILKKITSRLVDVHGQSEHFALLKPNFQLKFIDNNHDKIAPTLEKLKHPSLKQKEIAEKRSF
ncbi:MAG: AAA family ATPase [Clostridia bacterium]|nr:AAA family ATPase [Clostridia bacterium]